MTAVDTAARVEIAWLRTGDYALGVYRKFCGTLHCAGFRKTRLIEPRAMGKNS